MESWLIPCPLTSFQLGVLFLPKTLQSVSQFSCTEKNRSNLVVANRSLSFYYHHANLSVIILHFLTRIPRITWPLVRRSRPSWSRFAGKAMKKKNHLQDLSDCQCHINSLRSRTAQKVSCCLKDCYILSCKTLNIFLLSDVPWSWDRRYTKKDVYGSAMAG